MSKYIGWCILFFCLYYIHTSYSGQVAIVHQASGIKYYVNNNQSYEEKMKKMNLLHELRTRMNSLIEFLKDAPHNEQPGVQMLIRRHSSHLVQLDELEESSRLTRVFAFNLNKGDRISICLSPENQINELFFVLMHEMAHSMTVDYNHNSIFWKNFKYLINVAKDNNLYVNKNYRDNPEKFCKYEVNHNPWFD